MAPRFRGGDYTQPASCHARGSGHPVLSQVLVHDFDRALNSLCQTAFAKHPRLPPQDISETLAILCVMFSRARDIATEARPSSLAGAPLAGNSQLSFGKRRDSVGKFPLYSMMVSELPLLVGKSVFPELPEGVLP